MQSEQDNSTSDYTRQCLGNGLICVVFMILQWLFGRKQEAEVGPFSAWNITGTYRGFCHVFRHFFLFLATSGSSTVLWVYVYCFML